MVNKMLAPMLDDVVDDGFISPRRMSERLGVPLAELARIARLHRNTLARPTSPAVQRNLGEIARILARAAAISGDPNRAVIWFRHQPIAGFDHRTAQELVAEGHAEAVMGHLEDLEEGIYA